MNLCSPNKYTHKTVRVKATIETDVYMDINVPQGIKDDDISQIIFDGILGFTPTSDWKQDSSWSGLDWRWHEANCNATFDSNAPDFSNKFIKLLEEPE